MNSTFRPLCLLLIAILASPLCAAAPKLPGARPVIDASEYPTLQAAIDAVPRDGGMLRLPPGEFVITEPLVIRVMTRGKFAYVGSSLSQNTDRLDDLRSNVSVIELSDPSRPRLRGSVDFPDARGPNGLEISGTMVFAAGGQTVQALDIANPGVPCEMGRLTSPAAFPGGADDAHDLVYAGGHLFVTAQTSHSLVILRAAVRPLSVAAH